MPSQIKIKYSLNFHHFYRLDFSTIKLVLCCVLNKFRTSSPPTSCYRLGLCSSTPSRSWWSWSLPALKNRPSVTATWTKTKSNWNFINHQLIKIKFFTLEKTWTRQQLLLTKGCHEMATNWQGRSGVPALLTDTLSDLETVHKKTWNPWLVRTEVSRLKEVG